MLKKISLLIFTLMLSITSIAFAKNSIESKLSLIQLPKGFKISIYADNVKGARSMTLASNGVVFVGSRSQGKVYALIPNANQTKVKKVIVVASGLNFPNGVAFHDGNLYVSEIQKVLRYKNILQNLNNPPKAQIITSAFPDRRWHGYKYIKFGPDGWLYIAVGMPCNSCDYRQTQPMFGTIMRMKPDGKDLQIYAKGVRNSVGFAWNPKTNVLWFTDNGQDLMGDNLPPDEINRASTAELDFGFPFVYGDNILAPGYEGKNIDTKFFTEPAYELQAHVAPLGMTFYTGKSFPKSYDNDIFVAEHGSWNRSSKVGYQVIALRVQNGKVVSKSVFAKGWLQGQKDWGRPVDVLTMPDGALLLSDDKAGVVYRIQYPGAIIIK